MSTKNNRTCCICRKIYSYCPVCNSEDYNKPTWYFIFHDENCKKIYEVCTDYRDKKISPKEAFDKLSKLDLSDLDNFEKVTKKQIEEIFNSQKSATKNTVSKKSKIDTSAAKENNKPVN